MTHGYSPFRAKNKTEEEHNEIFRNILKYKFKIENEKLSDDCKDLITKLLSPDTLQRIKAKDIFTHPWVIAFEKESKEEKNFQKSKTVLSLTPPTIKRKEDKDENFKKIDLNQMHRTQTIQKSSEVEENIEKN